MTSENERWAEALQVERQHGDAAPVFIATRIGTLAAAGDEAGVRRWREIAAKLDQLMRGVRQ